MTTQLLHPSQQVTCCHHHRQQKRHEDDDAAVRRLSATFADKRQMGEQQRGFRRQ